MKLEKIVLVEVLPEKMWETGIYTRHSAFDPIAIEYIGAVAEKEGYKIKIIQQRGEGQKELLDKILIEEPDLIGYSAYTYAYPSAKNLAQKVKEKNKEIINVFGNYHVSALPEEAKDEAIDFIVLGEGEYSFLELLNSLRDNKNIEDVNGIAFYKDKLIITSPRKRIDNLDELSFPLRFKEYLEKNKIINVVFPTINKQKSVAQITYSRGCSHKCSYCASPKIWGPKVRHRSAKNLVDEIEYLQKEFGTNYIFFTDLTFNLNKNKVYELCNEIKNRRIEINWYPMCRPDPDKNVYKAMKEAGCTRIAWGIESLNDTTLEDILRNHNTHDSIESINIADSLGIITRGFTILGWPQEEEYFNNFKDYINKSLSVLKEYAKNGLDGIRLSFLTPLPGTRLYDKCEEKNLFLTKDFSKYSSDDIPIIKLNKLTPEKLIKARKIIFKEFHESKEYSKHVKDKISRFPHLKESFNEYFEFLRSKGIKVEL